MFEDLDRWIDGLPPPDPAAPEALGDEIVALRRLAARLEAAAAARLAVFDRSGGWSGTHVSLPHWLQERSTCSRSEARRQVAVARLLDVVPNLAACYAGGEVSTAHLVAVADGLHGLPPEVIGAVDDWLAEAAVNADPYRLRHELTELRQRLAPAGQGQADESRHAQRRLTAAPGLGGMTTLWGQLTAEKHAAAISAASRPDADGEHRTPGQRSADAYERILDLVLDGGRLGVEGGERPHLNLMVDLDTLAGPEDGAGNRSAPFATPGGVPRFDWTGSASRHTARRIACDAIVTRFDRRSGEITDVGRATRIVPAGLRRLIMARDNGCRWPGCTMPARAGPTSTTCGPGPRAGTPTGSTVCCCARPTTGRRTAVTGP